MDDYSLFDKLLSPVLLINDDFDVLFLNRAAKEAYSYHPGKSTTAPKCFRVTYGRGDPCCEHDKHCPVRDMLEDVNKNKSAVNHLHKDDYYKIEAYRDDENKSHFFEFHTNISELINLRNQLELEKEAYKDLCVEDGLTGIFNRKKFDSSLEDLMKLAFRYKRPLSLVMFDIDRFKEINDALGHQAGDSVLRELTQLVGTALRDADIFARYGGEEFMLIMPETDISHAKDIAERIRKTVENHIFKYAPSVTISLGVSRYADGETPDGFVKRADAAMYKAKSEGRNRTEAFL